MSTSEPRKNCMSIAASLLPEFDHEMATTRSLLALVPESDAGWRPHPKSFTLGDLAAHIVNLLTWADLTFDRTEFDANPPGGEPMKAPGFAGTAALLDRFDEGVERVRAVVASQADTSFLQSWTLLNGGNVVLSMPRAACWRLFIMNHIIHHRGQLSVNLRLKNVPLPSIYGPTADMA